MTVSTSSADRTARARAFVEAHRNPGIVVLPNAWDVGSAIMMVEAGFAAIATTSAGIAYAQGLPDGERIGRTRMLEIAAHIAAAVPVPVTADLEAGYGPRPEDVALTVREAISAGLAGCNIEDATGLAAAPLFEFAHAVERIQAGAEAVKAAGRPFVLNARTDPYLVRRGEDAANFDEAVKRANAYRKAGADCLYVPGSLDAGTIGRLVKAIDGPLNVLGARGGARSSLTVAELESLGVRRVSIGGSLSLAMLSFAKRAVMELRERGTFDYSEHALSNAEADRMMAKYEAR